MKIIITLGFTSILLLTSCAPSMNDIQQQVATDSVKAYELKKRIYNLLLKKIL